MNGTAFFAGSRGRIITAAHVVPTGLFTFQGIGKNLKPEERVVTIKLAYQLPEYDLAVFDVVQGCKDCVTCKHPFEFGDGKKVRPGDKLFYLGWTPAQGTVQANIAEVQATGSAANGKTTIDFFEFNGVGLPGYSGGPVITTDGKVVGVMREAWMKQGVKGGVPLLMNRAFSIEPVARIENKP
jgi:S1-C subfamily serine protease